MQFQESELGQDLSELSLADMFAIADKIGNKYQTDQEIQQFKSRLAKAVESATNEISKKGQLIQLLSKKKVNPET